MDSITKKTLKVSRGFTYTYYASPATNSKPTVLLQHGFPDDASEWANLITQHLVPAGYGVIAPDLLGYAGTSKPTDPAAFKYRLMVRDLIEILDAENVPKIISLGHDWGSGLAQRVYNLAPERTLGLVMANVAYLPPSNAKFDLDQNLAQTQALFGYGLYWYWKLFTAPDGAELLGKHLDAMFNVLHATGEVWKETLCKPDGVRNAVQAEQQIQPQAYATEEMRKTWVGRMQRDGLASPLCWYRATVEDHQMGEADETNAVVNVPTLFVAYNDDVVCRKEIIGLGQKAGLLPHLTVVELDGTHWGLLDKPKEFGDAVIAWLDANFGSSKL